jgi:hypothetical protein
MKPYYHHSFNIVLYDVTKNKLIFTDATNIESAKSDDVMNSSLYDFLFEIKSKQNKK